ncbi:MAG: type II secretion system protein GspC [Myxococcaceae bacterium]
MSASVELFFRRYFWTLQLAFVLLAAFLCAKITHLFVAQLIAPPVVLELAPRGAAPTFAAALAPPALSAEGLARVTGLSVPSAGPDVLEPGDIDPNGAPVKSDLRLQLLGTLVASDPQWSFASLYDINEMRSGTYRVGDTVMGAELLEIERTRVIVRNNGRREYIAAEAQTNAPAIAAGPAVTPPGGAIGAGVRATGENSYEVPRADIDKALTNLNDLAMQARIVPAFKDGVAQGFKLFSIRPDSLYSKIGIVNGDVIRRINGFDMNSPEKALEIYSRLKDANRVDIELERNGSPLRKQYSIR